MALQSPVTGAFPRNRYTEEDIGKLEPVFSLWWPAVIKMQTGNRDHNRFRTCALAFLSEIRGSKQHLMSKPNEEVSPKLLFNTMQLTLVIGPARAGGAIHQAAANLFNAAHHMRIDDSRRTGHA